MLVIMSVNNLVSKDKEIKMYQVMCPDYNYGYISLIVTDFRSCLF